MLPSDPDEIEAVASARRHATADIGFHRIARAHWNGERCADPPVLLSVVVACVVDGRTTASEVGRVERTPHPVAEIVDGMGLHRVEWVLRPAAAV